MKVLVTGGGGFLGRYVVRDLLDAGHSVASYSRSRHAGLEAMGVPQIPGDLSDLARTRAALRGMDGVVHVAAFVRMWGLWDDFHRTNVLGTRNLIRACREEGVSRLVYTSSPSVVFGRDDLLGVDEDQPYPSRSLSAYARSKAMAEREVLQANDPAALCTTSLRPHLIYGPGDPHLLPGLAKAAKEGRLRIVGRGDNLVDFIYVENASRAHVQALEALGPGSPVCGKAYFIGQEKPVKLWDFLNWHLPLYGAAPVSRRIPGQLIYAAGALFEAAYTLLGIHEKDPPMTRFVALQLSRSHYFSHARAHRDFGYAPEVSFEEAYRRLEGHLRAGGERSGSPASVQG